MEPAVLSALAAILGSVAGGSATVATAWITQRTTTRRERINAEIGKRELLYTEFVAECSRLAVDAFTHTLESPETMMPAYALLYRIRLTSSQPVVHAAERTVRKIAEQYFARNMTVDELREHARSTDANPLEAFSDACRLELKALRDDG